VHDAVATRMVARKEVRSREGWKASARPDPHRRGLGELLPTPQQEGGYEHQEVIGCLITALSADAVKL
jgi:hypothetical protein